MLADHIREHNVCLRGEYYMEPEKLDELLNTKHHDATMTTLKDLVEKHVINVLMVITRVFFEI